MAKRNRHNLSSHRLLTGDMGNIYPCGLVEVLPGDNFRHNSSAVIRLSPMAAPVYHSMTIRIHHFFVPHRLTWSLPGEDGKFEDFITGGDTGNDAQTVPTLTTTGAEGDVLDYLGLPVTAGISASALPLRAYNLIYNEWYRDQDLILERGLMDTSIAKCAWEKDYFSIARPWPQKGEEVSLPLGIRAPVRGIGKNTQGYAAGTSAYETDGTGTVTYASSAGIGDPDGNDGTQYQVEEDPANPGFPNIWTDLSNATAATINALRRASALQRFMEERARYGSRYAEYVGRAFGARPLDARLQRPEYLGGGTSQVSVSEILQTAPEDDTGNPEDTKFGVGDLYGHGVGMAKSNRYNVKFSEHGYVMSLVSVRPKAMYTNGIDRTWLRQDREDFYQRELAHIGQQQVLEQEVYADATNEDNVFGWSDRYAEYRTTNSRVTGEFRKVLDYWHLSRQFESPPALNETFVSCDPSKRIFNVTDPEVDALWMTVQHNLQALRVVPRNAVARLL